MPPSVRSALTEELATIQRKACAQVGPATEEPDGFQSAVSMESDAATEPRPHYQGRTLNFRAFMYAPTCEHDVVQMFGAIAHDLGFEIIGNRSEFPDCKARRKVKADRERFEDCLIEYEFSSLDYKKHKHPTVGCDLIVCWRHNWQECPIEVFSLEDAIKELNGWK